MNFFLTTTIGIYFGIVLVKSEVASWYRVQSMFRFDEPHMFLVIGSAVIIGLISVKIIYHFDIPALDGETAKLPTKKFNKGTKKVSKWIQHVLTYAKVNNLPFKVALKSAKKTYKK